MKAFLYLTIMCSLCSAMLYGQRPWSIALGIGDGNTDVSRVRPIRQMTSGNHFGGQMFHLSVNNYQFHKRWFLTASVNYVKYSGQDWYIDPPYTHFDYTVTQYGLTLGVGYRWLDRKWLEGSSSLELGAHLYTYDYDIIRRKVYSVHQLNLAKLRFGRRLGGYAGIGHGIKGMGFIGLDYRF